jgi:TRAP-type C4-dicarboxylate transport system permease small subunit
VSALGWATWIAIAVLVAGSGAVFLWFLAELWKNRR